jgi:CRISPR-associated protein Cmr5
MYRGVVIIMQTRNQMMAQRAYQCVRERQPTAEFSSFARDFPTLVHTCGLAQAVAFARAKGGHQEQYLADLAAVLSAAGHSALTSGEQLANETRTDQLAAYLRLSRDALLAAVWVKRYVESAPKIPIAQGGS